MIPAPEATGTGTDSIIVVSGTAAPGATYTNDFARRAKAKFQVSGLSRDATGA